METIEELGIKVNLQGREVFLCTYNIVPESISEAGSSKSEVLFDLVMRLHFMSMHFKCNVFFIHVAGTWIIRQGTDGLSRGDMYEGITKGKMMIYFLPLEKSALDRSPALSKWIEGWDSTLGMEVGVLEADVLFEHLFCW